MKNHSLSLTLCVCLLMLPNTSQLMAAGQNTCDEKAIIEIDRHRVIANADGFLMEEPRTVVADRAERSAGGPNDFFSEGDYWWPVPNKPEAPYERRDGQSNPDNFIAHRLSMIRFANIVGALTSAYLMTGKEQYAIAAYHHLHAWFVAPETRMNPNLLYGQAIKGHFSGRSIGIIDTLHLVDVALSAKHLSDRRAIPEKDTQAIRSWFADYAHWMNTHPYGIQEREHPNNHSVAWSLQIAAFAHLTGDDLLMDLVRYKFKNWYVPDMMADNGSFPRELGRTKPLGYSLFVIDLMAGIAQLASTEKDNLWTFRAPNGHNIEQAIRFIAPYIKDKLSWPYRQDIEYWDEWPMRHPSLLFAGYQLDDCDFFNIAKPYPAESAVYEIRRNQFIRYPTLWTTQGTDSR